ncbi:hypothetical protein NIES267_36670 [Calothrix parasitica NIES-267]|uniref:DUF2262 domain-containing protein n=1 Tax=Calothrix parasitica NIES-267 TaxID=1973488 RepID=A0A1Z4LSN0_9CYAN|nr:hypothetical protein NIES267_36670 [Calothrix parasitica NIES-267]
MELIYDNEHDCWKTKLEIHNNHFIDLTIETEDKQTIQIKQFNNQILPKIIEIIKQEASIIFSSANELVDLYNRSWNDNENIDCDTFIQQIKLEEIVFNLDENSFQFWYNDGDLFLGHAIVLDVGGDGLFQDVQIVG